MNTLHLFLTFALIHAPFALAQTVQEKFEQLVNLSNQEVPKCKSEYSKSSYSSNLESSKKTTNILTVNFNYIQMSDCILKEVHTQTALLKNLQNLNQQKQNLLLGQANAIVGQGSNLNQQQQIQNQEGKSSKYVIRSLKLLEKQKVKQT